MDPAASLFGEQAEAISRYVDILMGRGIEWGLLGPREGERIWNRHIQNSIAVSPEVPIGSRVIDVGSGAGLPGIPLALYREDLEITLLESLLRRSKFLELAVAELGLADRVKVVRARAEDHTGSYDVVTCRAVASLPKLLDWCAPLFGASGRLVALKGESASTELAELPPRLARSFTGRVAELPVPGATDVTWAVVLERRVR